MAEKKKKGIIGEFKEFITRGNVIDLAVGLIMGSAFTAIVNSLVNQLIMPVLGIIIGKIDSSAVKGIEDILCPRHEKPHDRTLLF